MTLFAERTFTSITPSQWQRPVRSRQTPADAFRLASIQYLAGEKIDMARLADELEIGRATLYRWVGDREKLLTEVIWGATKASLDRIAFRLETNGYQRLNALFGEQLEVVAKSNALTSFLSHEGSSGIQLLTKPRGVHTRHVLAGVEHVYAEIDKGVYQSPIDPETLVESIISLSEHFLYADFLGGFSPKVTSAQAAISLLLREHPKNTTPTSNYQSQTHSNNYNPGDS
jgi:AcrR family transcriptional regulator